MKTKERISYLKDLLPILQIDNGCLVIIRLINYSGKLLPFFPAARLPFGFQENLHSDESYFPEKSCHDEKDGKLFIPNN